MNEKQIIKGLQRKSERVYEILIDAYTPYVASIVTAVGSKVLNKQDIEEITADIFIKIWVDSEKIHIRHTLKGYLAMIARNKCIDYIRKKGQLATIPLEEDRLMIKEDTEQLILSKEQSQIIQEVVEGLQEPDKTIFIKRYFYWEKIGKITSDLEINENTIATKLRRTKEKLRNKLVERGIVTWH